MILFCLINLFLSINTQAKIVNDKIFITKSFNFITTFTYIKQNSFKGAFYAQIIDPDHYKTEYLPDDLTVLFYNTNNWQHIQSNDNLTCNDKVELANYKHHLDINNNLDHVHIIENEININDIPEKYYIALSACQIDDEEFFNTLNRHNQHHQNNQEYRPLSYHLTLNQSNHFSYEQQGTYLFYIINTLLLAIFHGRWFHLLLNKKKF